MYLTIAVTFRANELIFIVFPGPLSNGCFMKMYSLVCVYVWLGGGGGGGGRVGGQKRFIRGGSAARSNPLPFYEPFLTDSQKK